MVLSKEDSRGKEINYIFFSDPEYENFYEVVNPVFHIDLEEYQAEDLIRYCTKLFYSKDIPVDYNKVIKIALEEYFKNYIGEKELKEMEDMKKREARGIEEARKNKIPKFDWDKGDK